MKTSSLIGLELRARQACAVAWNLWAAQGGMRPRFASPLAAKAKAIAQQRSALAELFLKLDRLFPLGYSTRWDRKGKGAEL